MQAYPLMNCPCYDVSSAQDVEAFLLEKIRSGQGGYTAAINALKIEKYNQDRITRKVIDQALIQTPDGVGAQLAFKVLHGKSVIKLDLPGLALDLANKHRLRLFLLGTSEDNNQKAAVNVKKQYPNADLVGRHHGFFKNQSEIEPILASAKPQIVMISLGSPKQEILSAELNKTFPEIIFVGSGGRLDILAGTLKRAPKFYIDLHIEWLYRLVKEPKRFKSQLGLVSFLFNLLKYRLIKQ